MAVLTRQFHYHEDGSHYETWYYLARDTETGKVFVLHEWSGKKGDQGERSLSIEEFLSSQNSSATDKLRRLIGTLVPEASPTKGA